MSSQAITKEIYNNHPLYMSPDVHGGISWDIYLEADCWADEKANFNIL